MAPPRPALIVLLVLGMLVPAVVAAEPAPVAVGQVFQLDGRAWIRPTAGGRERPATRGAVLYASDHLRVAPGAELGIYYRQGGRRIVSGGRAGISGAATAFVPALQPYRSSSVTFGATRAPQADLAAAIGGQDTPAGAGYTCTPEEPPIFLSPPSFTLGLALDAPETPIVAALGIRIRDGETVVAEASLSSPRPGQRLRLASPSDRTGRPLSVEIYAVPFAMGHAPFVHDAPYYVLAPATADTAARDLATGYLFGHGTLAAPPGSRGSGLHMQRELEGGESATPTVVTELTPLVGDRVR